MFRDNLLSSEEMNLPEIIQMEDYIIHNRRLQKEIWDVLRKRK